MKEHESLATEAERLRDLYDRGRFDEVLAGVDQYRTATTTTDATGTDETVVPSDVHESILRTGLAAARAAGRWSEALDLSSAVQRSQSDRGVDEQELAATRFNDYVPLLRLGQGKEARELLQGCRAVYAQAENMTMLGNTLSALADAEAQLGGVHDAVREETEALRLRYRGQDPEAIAVSHYNLANYLMKADRDIGLVWAHRLAAALIRYRINSPRFTMSVESIGRLMGRQESAPLLFDDVCALVDGLPEIGFTALFERLPRRVGRRTSGDVDEHVTAGQADLDVVIRQTLEVRESAMRESVAAWEPVISALVASQQPETSAEATDVLSEALLELRDQYAWRELIAVLTRIQAGPFHHSEQTIGFLDPVSAAIAERAKAALAGEVTVDPAAWRLLTEDA